MLTQSLRGFLASAVCVAVCAGCGMRGPSLPETLGERQTSYAYIPLDPLPVRTAPGRNCVKGSTPYATFLDALPDQAVRMAIGQHDLTGRLVYGPATIGFEGRSYQVVLDYVSVDAANLQVIVQKRWTNPDGEGKVGSIYADAPETARYQIIGVIDPDAPPIAVDVDSASDLVNIPVYVGVGLRLTASVTVTNATANLSSLAALAAAAEDGRLTGSLTVQTLGISGRSVSTSLPLPSELNQTTIQNAILALGSIKAILYDQSTAAAPRVVGIYNPVGGGQEFVNGIISALASSPIIWYVPCSQTQPLNPF